MLASLNTETQDTVEITAYKLLRKKKNGELTPLFINKSQQTPFDVWLPAEDHPTKGYAHRPGWHCCYVPLAPHMLSGPDTNRVWCEVRVKDFEDFARPDAQGGTWILAKNMKVVRELTYDEVNELLREV